MLKVRIMPILLYKDFTLVKGIKFNSWRRIGSVMQAVKIYNMREVDELIFLDIQATSEKRRPDFNLIDEIADECFSPFSVGGGISTLNDVKKLLRVGADKVVINTVAVKNQNLIKEIANHYGSQCVVISIDAKKINNKYKVFTHSGKKATEIDPCDLAKKAENLGAGEILITSIECDGAMNGYDIELVENISKKVSIPVIASGGAKNYEDMKNAIDIGASAVAATSIFHFTEQTPLEAKKFLKNKGIPTRI